jgi:hypothetical protein
MDPITSAIVAALAKLAEPAVKDAYDGLKALILRKLKPEHQSVAQSIDHLEKKPEAPTRQADLAQEVKDADLTSESDVLVKARELLQLIGQSQAKSSQTVFQNVSGDHNMIIGIGSAVVDPSGRRS